MLSLYSAKSITQIKNNKYKMNRIERLAKAVHEMNRTYCVAIGDNSQVAWDDAPDNIKNSAIVGVQKVLENPHITPEELHEKWKEFKVAEGWVYGEVKDAEAKTHPCIVPYSELPVEQRVKDSLFRQTINTVAPLIL